MTKALNLKEQSTVFRKVAFLLLLVIQEMSIAYSSTLEVSSHGRRVTRSFPSSFYSSSPLHPDDRINPPYNVSIVLTSWFPPAVRVGWNFYDLDSNNSDYGDYNLTREVSEATASSQEQQLDLQSLPRNRLKNFLIKYNPIGTRSIRKFIEVPSTERNVTLENLDPSREYYLEVVAVSTSGARNSSHPVLFVSPANDSISSGGSYGYGGYRKIPKFRQRVNLNAFEYDPDHRSPIELPFIKLDEAVIVVVVLCVWFGVIYVFCTKWGKIRHLEPYQPDYHKRESTDTEVIVDPFSSFSATHYNPKLQSRMNTLNTTNNNNSVSVSNFASIETNPGVVNFMTSTTNDKLSLAKRKASMSLNEVNRLDQHRKTYSHGGSARFNYQSFSPRLYHCASTGVYHRRPQDPSAGVGSVHHHSSSMRNRLFSQGITYTTPSSMNYSFSSCRPSFSLSSTESTRRHSSVHHNPMLSMSVHAATSQADESKCSTPCRDDCGVESAIQQQQVRHHSLLPLPPDFKLSPERKIKSAEDLKTLVLELTRVSRQVRGEQQLVAETYQ